MHAIERCAALAYVLAAVLSRMDSRYALLIASLAYCSASQAACAWRLKASLAETLSSTTSASRSSWSASSASAGEDESPSGADDGRESQEDGRNSLRIHALPVAAGVTLSIPRQRGGKADDTGVS